MKTLLKKDYKTRTKKSSSKIVITRGSAARLYQRFVRGEETVNEQYWFTWSPGWSFGRFHDANGLELIDEHQSGDQEVFL